ncbi:hypothetical protein FJ422_16475 [Mesorhizobium sp. B2-6-3]|uniref:hypothetical protein n=1 Tax=Mesorhizobium sp. B2-6-3 TaxID=2589914 RepID=UPI00112B3A46|nr:hypothetical protein [Mesorhizobium sp. B2-6-3]TPJ83868.1 hypothetical protein FJ422_16475 [Mesorhizobium sp. B2-6-3]
MSGTIQPIDRLDYAVLAFEMLNDLVAGSSLQEVESEKLSLLYGLVADEIRNSAQELRRNQ